jgi:chromosome segregation ATPase
MNKKLLGVGQTIEKARQRLYETSFVADTALQELEQERHIRQQCSDAYKETHAQYGKKVGELHEMKTKCMSLHKELEDFQKKTSNYKSAFKEFESSIAAGKVQLEDTAKDVERKTSELQVAMKRIHELEKEVSKALTRECFAKEKDGKLEEEKVRLIDELEEERGHLGLALQKIHNLENEKEDAERRHLERINEMIARENIAEQKIVEQRQKMNELIQKLQAGPAITMDRLNPAEGKLERKRAANLERGRPSKYRKCKDTRKVGEEDTIEV